MCRHVILPKDLAKTLPKSRLLSESEWRSIGVQQSRGWQHYALHRYVRWNEELATTIQLSIMMRSFAFINLIPTVCNLASFSPEPHILLFRRPLGTDPQSGCVDPDLLAAAREEYKDQCGLLRNACVN